MYVDHINRSIQFVAFLLRPRDMNLIAPNFRKTFSNATVSFKAYHMERSISGKRMPRNTYRPR